MVSSSIATEWRAHKGDLKVSFIGDEETNRSSENSRNKMCIPCEIFFGGVQIIGKQTRRRYFFRGRNGEDELMKLLGKWSSIHAIPFHSHPANGFVAALKNRCDEEGLQFTVDMINDIYNYYCA